MYGHGTPLGYESGYELTYKAGGDSCEITVSPGEHDPYIKLYDTQRGDWRPSIHMPRWACRLELEITNVRVERLQDISEADAIAEGVNAGPWEYDNGEGTETARESFHCLWDSPNAARGCGWDANPWVWVVGFRTAAA
ncbi:hypothetical protein [Paraburkholderia aspalathi]|uniref:hypothetical protein n=1 Tax=Paraburkholderia aspalathi TaxID=1324617 RepID=UPI0038BC07AE